MIPLRRHAMKRPLLALVLFVALAASSLLPDGTRSAESVTVF